MELHLKTASLKKIQLIAGICRISTAILKYAAIVLAVAIVLFAVIGYLKFPRDSMELMFNCPWNNIGYSVISLFIQAGVWVLIAVFSFFAHRYFVEETKDGIPFTFSGANRLKKISKPYILSGIIIFAIDFITRASFYISEDIHFSLLYIGNVKYFLVMSGLLFLFLSAICKYGAEINEYLSDE